MERERVTMKVLCRTKIASILQTPMIHWIKRSVFMCETSFKSHLWHRVVAFLEEIALLLSLSLWPNHSIHIGNNSDLPHRIAVMTSTSIIKHFTN